jgi:hydrogenase maturation factor
MTASTGRGERHAGAADHLSHHHGYQCATDLDRIPIAAATLAICRHYRIDPPRLIGSGGPWWRYPNDAFSSLRRVWAGRGIEASAIGRIAHGDARDPSRSAGIVSLGGA